MAFIQFRINRKAKSGIRRFTSRYANCHHLGIIFSREEESLRLRDQLINLFEQDGKNVSLLEFRGRGSSRGVPHAFSMNDFSLLGNLKNEYVETFLSKPFDYIFCLNTKMCLGLRYLLSHSQANCRVGLCEEEALLDIIFLQKENTDICHEIHRYIKMIS